MTIVDHDCPLVILGGGYTGRVIFRLASAGGRAVTFSSRDPQRSLKDFPASACFRFELADSSTWPGFPDCADVIWTFPAEPLDQVQAFVEHAGPRIRRLVVHGSSSAYDRAPEVARDEWITERTDLDLDIPRVQGEEWLRARHHATVLRIAGIYGPGRNPLNWIRQGRVPYTTRWVNLIHVEDLAAITLTAVTHGVPGDSYNVSDGTPRRWSDIMDVAAFRWGVARPAPDTGSKKGKRLLTDKLKTVFGYTIQHPDLFGALEVIEKARTG